MEAERRPSTGGVEDFEEGELADDEPGAWGGARCIALPTLKPGPQHFPSIENYKKRGTGIGPNVQRGRSHIDWYCGVSVSSVVIIPSGAIPARLCHLVGVWEQFVPDFDVRIVRNIISGIYGCTMALRLPRDPPGLLLIFLKLNASSVSCFENERHPAMPKTSSIAIPGLPQSNIV